MEFQIERFHKHYDGLNLCQIHVKTPKRGLHMKFHLKKRYKKLVKKRFREFHKLLSSRRRS